MEASTKRLDFLLIIGRALRQLDVAALVDEIVPMDPRSRVSAGECVEALIVAILLGRHTLYRIDELLAPYDLELAFGWKGSCAQFHDDRLARALDDTFAAGPTKIQAAALVRAVKVHELELATIHVDTSSVSVYGEYAASVPPLDPEDERAIPHITRGHSKDYRSDLKQTVYGLAVACDGGVAVLGRVSSGNRSDPQETRWLMGRLAEVLPDPRGTTIVGDAKLFSGETLLLAQKHGFHVLTMMPRGVGLWGEAFTAFRAALAREEPLTRLKVVYPKAFLEDGTAVDDLEAEPEKEWNGRSCDLTHRWKDESTGVEHEFPIRALVVESTSLREQKTAIVEARRDKERKSLERIAARLGKREFRCEEDARRAAAAAIERHGSDLHRLVASVTAERRPVKRPGPGVKWRLLGPPPLRPMGPCVVRSGFGRGTARGHCGQWVHGGAAAARRRVIRQARRQAPWQARRRGPGRRGGGVIPAGAAAAGAAAAWSRQARRRRGPGGRGGGQARVVPAGAAAGRRAWSRQARRRGPGRRVWSRQARRRGSGRRGGGVIPAGAAAAGAAAAGAAAAWSRQVPAGAAAAWSRQARRQRDPGRRGGAAGTRGGPSPTWP